MKPKCPKCGKSLDSPNNLWGRTDGASTVACFCGWSRRVSRAAIIRLATQGKPETCKWRDSAQPIGCLLTHKRESTPKFCSGCGKPVEVVG